MAMDPKMVRHLIQVTVVIHLMCCLCLLVVAQRHQSSSAPAAPAPASAPSLPPSTLCIPRERDALLVFKAGLTDPGNYLWSWQAGQDCCRWSGVQCSNRTGHVVKLQIKSNTTGPNQSLATKGGEVSSSLLALRHLQALDLSWNNFGGRPIPEFIGAITSLRYLDLFCSNFGGRIPPHLGNLSNLVQLTIDTQQQEGSAQSLYATDLAWVSRLGKLQSLSMSGVNLSTVIDWAHAISMLPSLSELDLRSCGLQNIIPAPSYVNLTSLENLYLSSNSFDSSLGAKNLFWNLPSLQSFWIDNSGIQGPIPDTIGNLTSLQYLNLYNNSITGPLPSTIGNLKKIQTLELENNFISMDIAELLRRLPKQGLQQLYLDDNNFTGSLPPLLGEFTSLTSLWLRYNHLTGDIPVAIRELTNLEELWLSSNKLQGIITEDHFTNMSSLQHLWISDNSLTLGVENTWNTPFRLISAGFSSCELGPRFPAWLSSQPINTLDISNTSINDYIPDEFWTATLSTISVLDLSRNQLVGRLPTYFSSLRVSSLDISSNQLVGPIPKLPDNILYLDLSENNISGILPSDIGAPMLVTLILFNNSISGTIPCSLLQLQQLEFLDLSENLLNGTLPNCLHGSEASNIQLLNLNSNNLSGTFPLFLQRSKRLKFLDLAYNKFSGSMPSWIGEISPDLSFLRLRSNMFSGGIPFQITSMKELQYLDLACNNFTWNIPLSLGNMEAMAHTPSNNSALFSVTNTGFTGLFLYRPVRTDSLSVVTKGQPLEFTSGIAYMVSIDLSCNSLTGQIPEEIGLLIALRNLNLSWNHLSSRIPSNIGKVLALESFDLSHNQLSGEIPNSLSGLTSLVSLNLSYNELSGQIPSGNQLRTLENQASSYIGNPGLCGPPLPKNCSAADTAPSGTEEKEVSLYLGMGIGCVVGLWTVFIAFLFQRKWRIICFSFTDCMYDWVYVQVAVNWATLTRKTCPNRDQN